MGKKSEGKKKFRIALGADHAGYPVKKALVDLLTDEGYLVVDMGTHSEERADYPDFAFRVGKAVASGRCNRGILACGTGIGMCIAANKVKGVRAASVWSVQTAKLAAEHNWANVVCVSGRVATITSIKKFIKAWLTTPPDRSERHERRIGKISKFEAKS